MVLDVVGSIVLYSNYNKDGVRDDGTRSCLIDAEPSLYCGGVPYDYISGLADQFHDIMHATEQSLGNSSTQSQLGTVAELVNIKTEGHISQHIYDRLSQYKTTRERNPNRKKIMYAILGTWQLPLAYREAWKHSDQTYPDFPTETRNIRLDLYKDRFAPHGQYGHTYSCSPVIHTPYNIPSGMCMTSEYTFLTMMIPSPSNSKCLIDVYLEPLAQDLQNL
ncbi:UNVERIFIED_CONTAM: hypothetical protein Sindi_2266300 [Sesamum indicum]